MNSIIYNHINQIEALCKTYNVKSLYAFGSVCNDRFNTSSDIDLLIAFNPMDFGEYADAYLDIADKFEKIFNHPVDLVTEKSLSNKYFIESINKTKTKIYG